MIVTQSLAWMHLPKTAGTTTDALFVCSGIPLLWRDPQDSYHKHLRWDAHPSHLLPSISGRLLMTNIRRLPYWLLSNLKHKSVFMGLDLELDPMRSGLFYRLKEDTWLPADWWIDYFDIDHSWLILRTESLKSDFLRTVSAHESLSSFSRFKITTTRSANLNRYHRALDFWFTPRDIKNIYASNPRWAALEKRIYGDIISL